MRISTIPFFRTFLAVGIAVASTPTFSEENALVPEIGDVMCVGYEAETNSCLSKITVRDIRGEFFHYGFESIYTDTPPNLSLVTIAQDRYSGGRFCGVAGSYEVAFDPPRHPAGFLTRIAQIAWAEELAKNNVCYYYRKCGSQYASVTFKGADRFPAVDLLISHHLASDPGTNELTVRAARSTEVYEHVGNVAQECLPAT